MYSYERKGWRCRGFALSMGESNGGGGGCMVLEKVLDAHLYYIVGVQNQKVTVSNDMNQTLELKKFAPETMVTSLQIYFPNYRLV
jgi:hypothetical protein